MIIINLEFVTILFWQHGTVRFRTWSFICLKWWSDLGLLFLAVMMMRQLSYDSIRFRYILNYFIRCWVYQAVMKRPYFKKPLQKTPRQQSWKCTYVHICVMISDIYNATSVISSSKLNSDSLSQLNWNKTQ